MELKRFISELDIPDNNNGLQILQLATTGTQMVKYSRLRKRIKMIKNWSSREIARTNNSTISATVTIASSLSTVLTLEVKPQVPHANLSFHFAQIFGASNPIELPRQQTYLLSQNNPCNLDVRFQYPVQQESLNQFKNLNAMKLL